MMYTEVEIALKTFCESLRDDASKMISFSRKHHMKIQKIYYICEENLKVNMLKITNRVKLGTIVVMHGNIEVIHITYVI